MFVGGQVKLKSKRNVYIVGLQAHASPSPSPPRFLVESCCALAVVVGRLPFVSKARTIKRPLNTTGIIRAITDIRKAHCFAVLPNRFGTSADWYIVVLLLGGRRLSRSCLRSALVIAFVRCDTHLMIGIGSECEDKCEAFVINTQ